MENEQKTKLIINDWDRPGIFNWQVPECCREGWASCPHVLKTQRKHKTNIGL